MRTLKFRVWSEEDRQYRTDCDVFRAFHGKTGCPATIYNDEGDRFDIEQFTGLADKNDNLIYEGDIMDDGNHICEIRWSEHFTAFEALNEDEGYESNVWFESKYGEVIGNIHENPELLEGKKPEPNWTDITHDDEAMERVLKGVAEMQKEILEKAEEIKKAEGK